MTPDLYKDSLKTLTCGKSLQDAIYVHKSALRQQSKTLATICDRVSSALKIEDQDWDLIKLFKKEFKISFLSYPDFYQESYPALRKSVLIDLNKLTSKTTSYIESSNPPILHRKELMVSPEDPYFETFCAITREGEAIGLYENPFKIGFKQTWEQLIAEKGFELVDGRLIKSSRANQDEAGPTIDRHLTALTRYELSTPFKTLAKNGYLESDHSIFDYGCGRGDDLRELQAHGINAIGWDPNFQPDSEFVTADITNIGFVINVIEDVGERIEALQRAHSLSKKLTVISAMVAGETVISKFKPFGDGVLTSRNTFQKYYSQSELKAFIEQTLDDEAIAVATGVFYVFKDKLEEQTFLLRRTQRHYQWNHLTADRDRPGSDELLFVKHRELLDAFWAQCLLLGRLPGPDEFGEYDTLKSAIGSPKKALRVLDCVANIGDLQTAAQNRRDDLLVYFALSLFGKRTRYREMPEGLQRDVKAFFGNYQGAINDATEMLFSVSNTELIEDLCRAANVSLPSSLLDGNKSLTFQRKYLEFLPPVLRAYVGCAQQLFGDVENTHLVKIHIHTGKVSFMTYDDFESSPTPRLRERIKVRLRDQDVDYFDYVSPFIPPVLYWKSLVIDKSSPDFNKQVSFDKRLEELGIISPGAWYGPAYEALLDALRENDLKLKGYRFFKIGEAEK
ncbi:MAG: DNA phosphorothioation-associated putative methyltransferase [Halieaceae bacterium]|nr:DNA phosphorothioation-associated putative methyltransferase [Halieaceae bacterium]